MSPHNQLGKILNEPLSIMLQRARFESRLYFRCVRIWLINVV